MNYHNYVNAGYNVTITICVLEDKYSIGGLLDLMKPDNCLAKALTSGIRSDKFYETSTEVLLKDDHCYQFQILEDVPLVSATQLADIELLD